MDSEMMACNTTDSKMIIETNGRRGWDPIARGCLASVVVGSPKKGWERQKVGVGELVKVKVR
jgi:hypothetical protein